MRTHSWLILSGLLAVSAGCAKRAATQAPLTAAAPTVSAPVAADDVRLSTRREPWQFADYAGLLISTPNYRVYTTIENERILERLPLFYEKALEHYTTALAKLPKPPVPLETFLFQSRSQWQQKTAEMLPDQARMFSNLGRGGFTTRGTAVLYYIDRFGYTRDTFAIAAHEGWHQYTQQTFKNQLPIWLEEGVATYMEGYRMTRDGEAEFLPWANSERRDALRSAVRNNRLIPLDELLTRSPQSFLNQSKDSLLTYYAQVWALTRFLAEGEEGRYKPALERVLLDAAEGQLMTRMMSASVQVQTRRGVNRVGPAVVQEYFNRNLAEFERQYLTFIDEVIRTSASPDRESRFR